MRSKTKTDRPLCTWFFLDFEQVTGRNSDWFIELLVCARCDSLLKTALIWQSVVRIGHFPIHLSLYFKPNEEVFVRNIRFHSTLKVERIREISNSDPLWKWDWAEFGNGLLKKWHKDCSFVSKSLIQKSLSAIECSPIILQCFLLGEWLLELKQSLVQLGCWPDLSLFGGNCILNLGNHL